MPFTGKHDFVEDSAQPKGKTAKKDEKKDEKAKDEKKDEKAKDEKSKPESDKAK